MNRLIVALLLFATPAFALPLEFKSGDRILLYGNSFIERMQEAGEVEAYIQLAHPDKKLEFRSLAWTGDEVGHRLRPEGYPGHLKKLLAEWPANHLILGFGMNESFHGEAGLEDFRSEFARYLDEMKRRHPGASITLLGPMEGWTDGVTSGAMSVEHVTRYADAIKEVAQQAGAGFVPLEFDAKKSSGITMAKSLLGADLFESVDATRVDELAKAVAHKHGYNATLTRPINAVVYYGVRARPNEYNAEMPRYHALLKKADAIIHDLVQHPESRLEQHLPLRLPDMEPVKGRDAKKGTGQIFPPGEQEKTLNVADGYALNLFASESDFPEMKNPLQIAFDHRGRLWVVTMPSFPHTIPGEQPSDKIIILEDTDRDGKADKCTTFCDGLNVPDGLVFYRDGVIVSAQPRLIYMQDTDGDDVADVKEEWLRGIDVTDAHHGGMIQLSPIGDVMFCDGVFHRSQLETPFGVVRGVDATSYRFTPNTKAVHREYQTLTPNPWKMTYDRWGNLHHMYGDGYVQDSHAIPWTPFGVYHPFGRACYIKYGKGSGVCAISSPNFPDEYQDGMASATLLGRYFVAISKTSADSGRFVARDRLDIVSSSNAAFRPVDMAFGFDGAMYISDFCSPIIGHAQHPMRDPGWDHEHGRIWRVVHTKKPVVSDWPVIEGRSPAALCELLLHPQDLVRDHVRNRFRRIKNPERALDTWVVNLDAAQPRLGQAMLEAMRIYVEHGLSRPKVLNHLLSSEDPMIRAAGLHLLRFQVPFQPMANAWLEDAAKDPHPRVRVQLIHLLSHLQQKDVKWAAFLGQIKVDDSSVVKEVLADASYGVDDARGPEVPILEKPADARIVHWLIPGEEGLVFYEEGGSVKAPKGARLRTWFKSPTAQRAILSVKTGYVTVHVNGVPVLHAATFWSSDWNVQIELREGYNEIDVQFGTAKRARGPVPVYVYSVQGTKLPHTPFITNPTQLEAARTSYLNDLGVIDGELRVVAVPSQLAFAPKELRVKAGEAVRLRFVNADLAMHNLVILKPGSAEAVGLLADNMALQPDAMQRHFVPESDQVLWATKLLANKQEEVLAFTAPTEKGRYPFLCTFPGHWRVMRGELVVE